MFTIVLRNGPLDGQTVSTEDRHDEIKVTTKVDGTTLSGLYRIDCDMTTGRWAGWDQDNLTLLKFVPLTPT